MNVVGAGIGARVGEKLNGVALMGSVGIRFGTVRKGVALIGVSVNISDPRVSTGVALEKRTLKAAMLRAQNESCMISLFML